MTSRFDDILDGVGFMRTDVLPLLASAGVLIDEKAMPSRPAEKRPDLRPFIPRVNVTLAEAADILAQANGGNWWATLEDAVDSGQIRAETWGIDRSEQPLAHADIREWCATMGIVWPVPLPPGAVPCTDDAPRQSVAELLAERETLRTELEEVTRSRDNLRATVADLEARYDHEMKVREVIHMGQSMERQRTAELAAEVERLQTMKNETGKRATNLPAIDSPTLRRIFDAVEQFPAWRDAQTQKPNLKAVLGWQEVQQAKTKPNSRLAYVAHRIIAEHFDLKK